MAVTLPHDRRRRSRLVQDAAQLPFDERPLLFDNDQLVDGGSELEHCPLDQRVGHREFQNPHSDSREVIDRQAKVGERLYDVVVGLAGAHDAQSRTRCGTEHAIVLSARRRGSSTITMLVHWRRTAEIGSRYD